MLPGVTFEVSEGQSRHSGSCSLPADLELSIISPAPYLPVCHNAPCYDDNGLNV